MAFRERARAAARSGRHEEAAALFDTAVALFPGDAALLNSAGSFHAGRGAPARALAFFDQLLAADPCQVEAGINRAIVLIALGRAGEALAFVTEHEDHLRAHPRYWNVRGNAALDADEPSAAAAAYDRALQRQAADARALQGRALAALQAGADDAVDRHERALAVAPGDRHVALGLAQALDEAGRSDESRQWSTALVEQLPTWVPGLELLAAHRWAAGERERFADHFDRAATPEAALAHAAVLAGVDRHADAARAAGAATCRWPDRSDLALAEAIHAGMAGDLDRAAFVLSRAPADAWPVERARHAIRGGDPVAADALLERALEDAPDDVAAWSLRDVAWRLSGDPRHEWLSRQTGLVETIDLALDGTALSDVEDALDRLHDRATMPIGQSVKDGTQTRGSLFARQEPALVVFRQAVERALSHYRDRLPPFDAAHPLLRRRATPWRFVGSWSIRLEGRGRHAAHIHPRGLLSSAAYVAVPASIDDADQPGWLEIGRPPADLRTDLSAIAHVRPRVGCCVLFPSYLFHGTRPIASGRRLTIAFDVAH